jgi:hypothetical protein
MKNKPILIAAFVIALSIAIYPVLKHNNQSRPSPMDEDPEQIYLPPEER